MEITLSKTLPPYPTFVEGIRRAPDRGYTLDAAQTATALKNALRYIPKELHETLAPEFMEELRTRGRIYGYRYRPQGDLKAKPIDEYKGRCIEGKSFQVMIDNNLCFDIALYPYELVTYGETGHPNAVRQPSWSDVRSPRPDSPHNYSPDTTESPAPDMQELSRKSKVYMYNSDNYS